MTTRTDKLAEVYGDGWAMFQVLQALGMTPQDTVLEVFPGSYSYELPRFLGKQAALYFRAMYPAEAGADRASVEVLVRTLPAEDRAAFATHEDYRVWLSPTLMLRVHGLPKLWLVSTAQYRRPFSQLQELLTGVRASEGDTGVLVVGVSDDVGGVSDTNAGGTITRHPRKAYLEVCESLSLRGTFLPTFYRDMSYGLEYLIVRPA